MNNESGSRMMMQNQQAMLKMMQNNPTMMQSDDWYDGNI
jgi:hypothetical protein